MPKHFANPTRLTLKQAAFAREYIIDGNGARAARVAGSPKKNAGSTAAMWLKKANIIQEIERLRALPSNITGITREMVIEELGAIGFSNIQKYLGLGNDIVNLTLLDEKETRAVASIKRTVITFGEDNENTKETVELKLWDKVTALVNLGKHFGIFAEDNNSKRALVQINYTNENTDEVEDVLHKVMPKNE